MSSNLIERARRALNAIADPCSVASGSPMGIEEMGLIESIEAVGAMHLKVRVRLTAPLCHNIGYFHVEIRKQLLALDDVEAVDVDVDNGLSWTPANISVEARARRAVTLKRLGLIRD